MEKYSLTIDDLVKLCRDFQVDNFDGFVSNDKSYIRLWLSNNNYNNYQCDSLGEIKKI